MVTSQPSSSQQRAGSDWLHLALTINGGSREVYGEFGASSANGPGLWVVGLPTDDGKPGSRRGGSAVALLARWRRQLRPGLRNPSVKLKHPDIDFAPFRWR
jgi:hypothetical protein